MIKKYKQTIEVEGIKFNEKSIDKIIDLICGDELYSYCFEDTREEVINNIKKHKKINIENPNGNITVKFGDYVSKSPSGIFLVWTEQEFKETHKEINNFVDLNKLKNYECFIENANIMTQYYKVKEEINEFYLEFMYRPNGEGIISEGLDVITAMYNYLTMIGLSKEDFDKHIDKLERYKETKYKK